MICYLQNVTFKMELGKKKKKHIKHRVSIVLTSEQRKVNFNVHLFILMPFLGPKICAI